MVSITCNGADRDFAKEYVIKAVGYGAVEDTLQPRSLYLLKGRLIPTQNAKDASTEKHEFFYDAPTRLFVGTTEAFASNLHDTVGVTGFGIVIHKSTIYEDSVQSKAVKEGKADRKPTTVIILRHGDYNPIVICSSFSCLDLPLKKLTSMQLSFVTQSNSQSSICAVHIRILLKRLSFCTWVVRLTSTQISSITILRTNNTFVM